MPNQTTLSKDGPKRRKKAKKEGPYQVGTPEQWARIHKEASRQCHEMNNVKNCDECQTCRRALRGVHFPNES